ncbi:MAG TPA: hypothetical protein VIJ04_15025 [Xanthobacteraceae bacterium]
MPAKTGHTKTRHTKTRHTKTEAASDSKVENRRDEHWDDRLRTVGDARFIEVEWSGKDYPGWPLPKT